MRKIRVLHIVHNFLKGGIEGFLYYLTKMQLANNQLDIHILCCSKERDVLNRRIQGLEIPIHYIDIKPFDLNFSKYYKICKLSKEFDLVHVHIFQPILCYALAFSPTPILFTMHGAGEIRRRKGMDVLLKEWLLKIYINHIASGIAHNSYFTQHFWRQHGITKCKHNEVIYNGVFFTDNYNPETVYNDYPQLRNKKIIGTSSRIISWKRVDILVETFIKCIPQLSQNWDLLVVGEGPELLSVKEIAIKNGAENRIHFVGYKSNVTDYQSVMDVCVFPSAEEPFGLVAIECLHLGKPVYVMSDGGGLAEIIHGLSDNFIATNIEDLSRKLIEETRGLKVHSADEAIKYSETFTIKRTEQQYFQLYKLLTKNEE